MLATRLGETPFTGLIPRAFSHFRALFTLLLVLSQIYASHSTGRDTIYETYTTCLLSFYGFDYFVVGAITNIC